MRVNEVDLKRINAIDLSPIIFKLVESDDGPQWSVHKALTIEKAYRVFLYLHLAFPNDEIVPTREVDEFWHQHILDSEKYFLDCQHTFGHYLHHFPYLGSRGQKDRKDLQSKFARTNALSQKVFGQSLSSLSFDAMGSVCGSGCSGKCSDRSTHRRPSPGFDYRAQYA